MTAPRKQVLYFVPAIALERPVTCRERECGAQIILHELHNGRRMPLDVKSRQPAEGGWNLEPHWGRCVGADRFRRTRPLQ